ncbi:Crp/Fnr family transcriptional regulator [Pseudoflavitalea rhizosphaerae]|uniref:Crp/Fnr family transcriptional regulator n=1 Tax=Pseudoflavitalea rhizosphaerae TaxID=1884793 RepID=UPI000F8F1978|nr:cyclic nucleotide-binding domain-containing protein [Pseudoflavitalea rhizosphaerae]
MEQLLLYLDLIAPMSQALKEHLAVIIKFKNFLRNEYLLKPGQYGNEIMFLDKGLVRCYYVKQEGEREREITRWLLKESDVIVSLNSFYTNNPSMEYIQAIEETHVGFIKRAELEFIYDNYPEFNRHGRLLSIKYQLVWDHFIYGHVMQNAEERFEWLLKTHPDLINRVPGKYLASYLGMDEATLSKTKKKILRQ